MSRKEVGVIMACIVAGIVIGTVSLSPGFQECDYEKTTTLRRKEESCW